MLEPAFEPFRLRYAAGEPQLVWRRLIDDLETPVAAYMKIGLGRPYAFLFESVEGGAYRGRYSIVALKPDLVWRCFGDRAEIAEGEAAIVAGAFQTESLPALASLRALVERSRIAIPRPLPPMAAGLFGAIGYDMIRLVEPVGPAKPDPLGLPDTMLMRPSVVAVFDSVAQEILLIAPVRPDDRTPEAAYDQAERAFDEIARDLRQPTRRPSLGPAPGDEPQLASPVTREAYAAVVERAKRYIEAGDVFQVVPSHRFRGPYRRSPFACYRALRRLNPSPFLYYLDFGGFQLAGSSPEILVRYRDGKVTIRPIAGTRPAAPRLRRTSVWSRSCWPTPRRSLNT